MPVCICQLMEQKAERTQADIDAALRDLIADVFDFLYEARVSIIKSKLETAYPLSRRAYESLSLMVACYLDHKPARKCIAGKKSAMLTSQMPLSTSFMRSL